MKKTHIELIENHDKSYYVWKDLKIKGKTLIHYDAHVDFGFHAALPTKQAMNEAKSKSALIKQLSTNLMYRDMKIQEKALTTIGNYIYPAIRDGIVNEFYWVIPGYRGELVRSAKNIDNIIRSLTAKDPFSSGKVEKSESMIKTDIYGKRFIITTIDCIPENIKDALVDIDTDFLTTDTIRNANAHANRGNRFPWIWPEELVSLLRKRKTEAACITIAYSVNGGFTPLIYKFLGDETALLLQDPENEIKYVLALKNKALLLMRRGKREKALTILNDLSYGIDRLPMPKQIKKRFKAHILFIIFDHYKRKGKLKKAKKFYEESVKNDKTYRVRDNNYGSLYLKGKQSTAKAMKEFAAITYVDKKNVSALCGLAAVYLGKNNIKKAMEFYRRAYRENARHRETLLGLTRVYIKKGQNRTALKYLNKVKDNGRGKGVKAALKGEALEGIGDLDKALDEYRIALRFGSSPALSLKVFKLAAKYGIPDRHEQWVLKKIKEYEELRQNTKKSDPLTLKKRNAKAFNERKKIMRQIDKVIKNVSR